MATIDEVNRKAKATKTNPNGGCKHNDANVKGYTASSRIINVNEPDMQADSHVQPMKNRADKNRNNGASKKPKDVKFDENSIKSTEAKPDDRNEPKPKGAGFRFGRRERVARMLRTAVIPRKLGRTSRILDVNYSEKFSHQFRHKKRIATKNYGEFVGGHGGRYLLCRSRFQSLGRNGSVCHTT